MPRFRGIEIDEVNERMGIDDPAVCFSTPGGRHRTEHMEIILRKVVQQSSREAGLRSEGVCGGAFQQPLQLRFNFPGRVCQHQQEGLGDPVATRVNG